ncbi:MAG: HAD-IB family phosphatase [Francisellaceae bacterium]
MNYDSVIFDFDSTLIRVESLEYILKDMVEDPRQMNEIIRLTDAGMSGQMPFDQALAARFSIARPTTAALSGFVERYCPDAITTGMLDLIQSLKSQGVAVFIISGGIEAAILPFARFLGIDQNHVFAVRLLWDSRGQFSAIDNSNGFASSKQEGARRICDRFKGRSVIIGDGMTDYALYHAGLVDDFIAYTEHVTRQPVVDVAPHIAKDVNRLKRILGVFH